MQSISLASRLSIRQRDHRSFNTRLLAGLALALVLMGAAHAHGTKKGSLVIDHPYALPSIPGVANGAAYLRGIENTSSADDQLIGASTAVAERVELHHTTQEGNVVRMREVPSIELPAKAVTKLRHDGTYHLQLINLKKALAVGERFDLTLEFRRAGKQTVNVWVQQPRDAGTEHKH